MNYKVRGIATIVAILTYVLINFMIAPVPALTAGSLAAKQFESSDTAYLQYLYGSAFYRHMDVIPLVVLLVILGAIWWKPVAAGFKESGTALLVIGLMLVMGTQASAYYSKENWPEPYLILPNESAFFIPDVGDNKTSQSKFVTEDYLRANKIPAKRFNVEHVKLPGSAYWSDYFVPAGRLMIVDRTPYHREWVKSAQRGTSSKNQGFVVQSKEGLNITLGISIAAFVTEENAPKFLFNFGVKPPAGDRTKPEVIFTSVYYGYSLTEVMDGIIRSKVQALLGNEFTKRPFEDCNSQADQIMSKVQGELTEYLTSVGISLSYIGWADTFEFDPAVQDAINRRFVSTQDKLIAEKLGPHTDTIKALASAEALRSFGNKTDGKLPTNVSLWWLPASLSDFMGRVFSPEPTPAKK
jgi:hypothetical protein